jgi:hypothetical protein
VVDAVLGDDPDQGGAERFQPLRLGADEPAPGLDRVRSPAADGDVECSRFLSVFFSGTTWNQIRGPLPAGSMMQSRPVPSSSSLTPTARQ